MAGVRETEQRLPLAERTNSSSPRPRSDPLEPVSKTLRRSSASTSCLHDSSDSSRFWPSEDSIFPAPVCSISQKLDELPTTQTIITGGASFEMLAAPSDTESGFVTPVHYPHTLDPIIEQRSASSLRNSPQLSLKQKASVISKLSLRRSSTLLRQLADTRRKTSFSLTDLTLFKTLANFLDTPTSSQVSLEHRPKIQPTMPTQPPLRRQSTPPDLPTFNSQEAFAYRLPRPAKSLPRLSSTSKPVSKNPSKALHKMLRERFTQHRALSEWRNQTNNLPTGAIMRGNDGTLVFGGWYPTQSGHTGHISPSSNRARRRSGQNAGPVKPVGRSPQETSASMAELLRQYGLNSLPPSTRSSSAPTPASAMSIEMTRLPHRMSSREIREIQDIREIPMPMPIVRPPTPVQRIPGGRGTHRGMVMPVPVPTYAQSQAEAQRRAEEARTGTGSGNGSGARTVQAPPSSRRLSSSRASSTTRSRQRMPLTLFCCCWTLGGEVAGSSEF